MMTLDHRDCNCTVSLSCGVRTDYQFATLTESLCDELLALLNKEADGWP